MPAVGNEARAAVAAAVQKRGLPTGTRASLILGLCLLGMILFLGALMWNFQHRLNQMDRDIHEARGTSPFAAVVAVC